MLWFKAPLRAELINQIVLESGNSLEMVNADKYVGQFGGILGIATSWRYVFWSLIAIVAPSFFLKGW